METLLESYGNKPIDDKELLAIRIKSAEFIEENKKVSAYISLEQIMKVKLISKKHFKMPHFRCRR